jgi:hypothetical protein
MEDIECSTCFSLQEAIDQLEKICYHIELSTSKGTEDFGLQKSYLKLQVKNIQKAQNWHQYFHTTGRSLSSANSDVNYKEGKRRWRPSQDKK